MSSRHILPTFDAYDEESFKKINRPHGSIKFENIKEGLKLFSEEFKGQLWLELMLMDGVNDDDESLSKYFEALKEFKYDRLYINTPVRPSAESEIKALNHDKMNHAVNILGGIDTQIVANQTLSTTTAACRIFMPYGDARPVAKTVLPCLLL